MRVAIASRIFEPEPSAASFRLAALATELAAADHEVTVLTATAPKRLRNLAGGAERHRRFSVRRFPVLRNPTGYVRGYLQYLSFDIPLFFRLLLSRSYDVIIAEPPPTTGFAVRMASAIRRTPFVYYAADIWSDATATTGAPDLVVRAVRRVERSAAEKALGCFAVNDGVARRLTAIAPKARPWVIGNGVDTAVFKPEGQARGEGEFIIYMGTASEWQGADIFIRAIAALQSRRPGLTLRFVGQGSAWQQLKDLALELDAPVEFFDQVPPDDAAEWLRGAELSVASIKPEANYEFAFPTKVFASWASGTPVVFAGAGPAREVLREHPVLGIGIDYDLQAVEDAVLRILDAAQDPERPARIGEWAAANVSLAAVARRAASVLSQELSRGGAK